MKKTYPIIVALSLAFVVPAFPKLYVAIAIPEVPTSTLTVTVSPDVLTAGVVPELIDPATPLTFKITDSSGTPVDLTNGKTVEDKAIWNNLFKDPHPEVLPQYYWTRLDLHNEDGSDICNKTLFAIQPIQVDFSRASDGIYVFRGFVANDTGEFKVQVYTPDRKHTGTVTVKVRPANIDYAIYNIEDPEKRVFHTPGDPDFIMTAADNRVYGITATVTTADGKIIRGISQGVETCGSKTQARLTVSSTLLGNFFYNKPTVVIYRDWLTSKNLDFIQDWGERYYINLGVDFNHNNIIEDNNREIFDIDGFSVYEGTTSSRTSTRSTIYKTFYNTACTMYDHGTFATGYLFDYEEHVVGWGMGCIYNSPYAGCFLFPDMNQDGKLNYQDSLALDVSGQTEFFVFANDMCGITCLLGVNPYGDVDFAGRGPINENDPKDVRKRYWPDYTFHLDFDGWVGFNLTSGRQITSQIKVTVNFNPEKLEVGKKSICDVVVTTKKDEKPIEKARVQVVSGLDVYATGYTDENGKVTLDFTPFKSGALNVSVAAGNYGSITQETFVKKDETPPILLIDEIPVLTRFDIIKVTGKTESGATMKINGKSAIMSEDGHFSVDVQLTEGDNNLNVVATDQSDNSTRKSIIITLDTIAPIITLDPIEDQAMAQTVVVKGNVTEVCKINIGSQEVITSAEFKFDLPINFGINEFDVTATDEAGNSSKVDFSITNFRRTSISLKVGSIEMAVDDSTIQLKVAPFIQSGTTLVPLRAISQALGATVNYDSKTKSIEILLGKTQVIMQVGIPIMIVNGERKTISVPPIVKESTTFVPFRAIAEAFSCNVRWASETKEIVIERLWY